MPSHWPYCNAKTLIEDVENEKLNKKVIKKLETVQKRNFKQVRN